MDLALTCRLELIYQIKDPIMKKIVILLALVLGFAACKQDVKSEKAIEDQEVAKEIPVLAMGEFEAKAGNYVDQEIQIVGIVDHVCKHSGKKLLVVTDDGQVHVVSDTRFDDSLTGSEILLNAIVKEERIDEATCLQMEEDNIKSHSEGATNDEMFENRKKHIQEYRDRMKEENKDYVSEFSLQYVAHKETATK
jgi:hypothetical protein